MSTVELRRKIKSQIDRLPPERLATLAEYVQFLNRPSLTDRLAAAEKAIASGKGVNWRKVRANVRSHFLKNVFPFELYLLSRLWT